MFINGSMEGLRIETSRKFEFSDLLVLPVLTVCRIVNPVFKKYKYDM
jgi:hypothetical protein